MKVYLKASKETYVAHPTAKSEPDRLMVDLWRNPACERSASSTKAGRGESGTRHTTREHGIGKYSDEI